MHLFDGCQRNKPQIDLQTARETLVYIRDDMAQLRELRHVTVALQEAISQIEVAEARAKLPGLAFFRNSRLLSRQY